MAVVLADRVKLAIQQLENETCGSSTLPLPPPLSQATVDGLVIGDKVMQLIDEMLDSGWM